MDAPLITAVTSGWNCPSCYQDTTPEAVQVRDQETREWADSTVQRCPLCKHTFGGTLEDLLAYIRDTYNYKYFGDYELSPEQSDAVWTAKWLASLVPDLLDALKELHLRTVVGTDDERHAALEKAWAAIAKAEGR